MRTSAAASLLGKLVRTIAMCAGAISIGQEVEQCLFTLPAGTSTAMEPSRASPLRKKIRRLGRDLEQLSRAIKEEIDAHERWNAAIDVRDGATQYPHKEAD